MKYYTDGFLNGRGNPCPRGGGYTIADEKGKVIEHEQISSSSLTNNEAEVTGIVRVLEICHTLDEISTDSKVCLIWVKAGFSRTRPDLDSLLKICNRLWHEKMVNLHWERREKNLAGFLNEFSRGKLAKGYINII